MKVGDKVFIPATVVENVDLGTRVVVNIGTVETFWFEVPENLLLTELPTAPQSDIICDPNDPRVPALIGQEVEVCDDLSGREGWKSRRLSVVDRGCMNPFWTSGVRGWRYIRPIRKPALKPITPKELAAMGYELKESDE